MSFFKVSFKSLMFSTFIKFDTSASEKDDVIYESKSILSTTYKHCWIFKFFCFLSFWAANNISKDLPDPWKCQIKPFLILPSLTRSTIAFAPSNCWYLQITFIFLNYLFRRLNNIFSMSSKVAGFNK